MPLEAYQVVFNTSIRFKESLPTTEKEVVGLFGEVMGKVAGLEDYRHEGDDFHLAERIAGNLARQILFQKKTITVAVAPPHALAVADETARLVYSLISHHLNPPLLVLELMDVSFRFEFPFKGNHDLLVLRGLFGNSPYAELAAASKGAVRSFQPVLNLSLTSDHSVIALIEIRTSTTSREIESGEYDGDEIRVLCGVARVRGLAQQRLEETYASLYAEAVAFVEQKLVPLLVEPLRSATLQT